MESWELVGPACKSRTAANGTAREHKMHTSLTRSLSRAHWTQWTCRPGVYAKLAGHGFSSAVRFAWPGCEVRVLPTNLSLLCGGACVCVCVCQVGVVSQVGSGSLSADGGYPRRSLNGAHYQANRVSAPLARASLVVCVCASVPENGRP